MLQTHDIESAHLGATRRITVWIPPGGRAASMDLYPVLYLNDGQNLFDPARAFAGNTWRVAETATRLVRQGRIPPLLIVGIDHGEANRASDYLPVADDRNADAHEPRAAVYAEFVTREVMPLVQRIYPAARGASSAGFGGSSYGAVAALYTSIIKPGVFGKLLLESPSLYVGGTYVLRRARAAARWPARVYLGVGTAETDRGEINDETVANVRRLEALLRRRRLGARRLLTVVEEGGTHSEDAWARRLARALEFLYGEGRSQHASGDDEARE
jgi:predicted alpha/beta superfamily hydrolase